MREPANKEEPKTGATLSLDSRQPVACSALTESLRVLVTDDNPTNRKLLRVVLEAENHVVLEADNGMSALQLLEQERVDAVISDILMPEMDGYRLCYEIRKSPRLRALPFIVYTASYTSRSDEKVALQFGIDKFLRKPATGDEIVKCLQEVIGLGKDRASREPQLPEADAMREYSQVLVRKLEETVVDLSEANKNLAERAVLAEFIAAVSAVLSQTNDFREMLQRCCDAMVKHSDAALARIWTADAKQNVLELRASSGIYTDIDGGDSRIPVGHSNIGLIASERRAHLTNLVMEDPRMHDHQWINREGMVAFAGYPLLAAEQLVGVMALFSRKPLSQNTFDVMGTVAQNIAVGVQRQMAVSELRHSEERFRELAENINEIFFVAEPDAGPVHYVSSAYEGITGRKREILYQNPHVWLESIHQDDRARIERAFRDLSENLDQEYRIVRPDGGVRWLRSRVFPLKDESGAVIRIVGIAADISKRKQAEEKVNQNLNRMGALHDINLAITSTLDLPTILKVLLAKTENLFPYPTVTTVRLLNQTTGELEALACHNIGMDDWKNSFADQRGGRAYQVLNSKVPLLVRNVLTHSDTVSPTLFQKYGLVSYIGLPLIAKDAALGVLNFYTKQEHVFSSEEIEFLMTLASQAAIAIHNAQLHEQTQLHLERIRAILESSLDCIITIDGEGKIIEFNPAAEKTFRYTRSEAIGRELSELIIPRSLREKHRRGLAHYLATGEGPVLGKRIEIDAMHADGTEFPVELMISRASVDGPPTFTGFIRDISERRRAEEAQKAHYAELQTVYELSQKVLNTLDLEKILQEFLNNALSIGAFDIGVIRLFEPSEKSFRVAASKGYRDNDNIKHLTIGLSQEGIGVNLGQVIFERKTVISENVPESEGWGSFKREGVQSAIMFPIKTDERLLGIVHLGSRQRQKIRPSEASLLEALASQAGIAIQKAGLYEQTQRNLERIKALHEIDLAITSTLDLRQRLDVLLEKIDIFLPFPAASTIRLLNVANQKFEDAACRNLDEQEWKSGTGRGTGELSSEFLKNKSPIIVPNIQTDKRRKNTGFFRKHGFVSYIGVPLVAKDNIVGVLGFYTKEVHEFTQQEIDFLTTLAGQAAIAIDNATLYEQTERQLKRIQGVSDINNAITSTLSLKNVIDVLLEKIELFSPIALACGVRLFDAASGEMVPLASRDIPFEEWRQEVANAKGRLTKLLIETRKPIAILNMYTDPRTSMNDFARRHGLVSYLGVPLIVRDEFIGNLVIYTKAEHVFSGEEIEFFSNLGSQAAIAIHNARLYEQTERRRREAEELAQVARSLTETLDPMVVGDRIVTSVRDLFAVQGATLRLRQPDGSFRRLASSGNVFSETSSGEVVLQGVGLTSRAIAAGKPVWSSDILNDPEVVLTDEMRDYQILSGNRSMIVVPLRAHEKLIGTLTLSDRTGRIYFDDEVALLQTFADQVALALENARLYEQTERQLTRIEALREIEKSITSTLDLGTVLNVLMEKIEIFFTYPCAATVRLFDKESGLLEPAAARNVGIGEWISAMHGVDQNEKSYGKTIIENAAPLLISNLQTDPRTQNPRFYRDHGLISYAGVPLIVKDEVLGVLGIYTKEECSFSNEEIELLMMLAGQTAIAIHNARLFEKNELAKREMEATNKFLDKSLNQLASLYTAMTPLAPSESLHAMMEGIIARLIDATGADAGLIRIWDKKTAGNPVIGQRGYSTDFVEALRPVRSEGAIYWVIEHGEPIIAPDIASEDRLRGKRQLTAGFQSCAILPLSVHDEVRGVIQISSRTRGYFDEEQKDHLLAVAQQMGIALENHELFYNLKASRDELERANRVKDEFLSVMSHELRTPLSVVLGYSLMFRDRQLGPLTNEQRNAVDVVLRNSQELLEMIESIMDATKIEAGSMAAEMDQVSPLQLLQEIRLAYDVPIAKNVRLEWQFPQSLPLLWSDARKLRQIITNLINNAIKFTEEGRIVIAAEEKPKADADAKPWIEFRVTDSGVGIPPEECAKIFDRFHQVDSSKARRFEGVGLGLYIVKSFTQMLGGRVSVCSELGKGSTFTVTLPIETAP